MRRLVVAMVVAAALLGCDRTEVRSGPRELTTLEPNAVRVLVAPAGIGTLVEIANPDGFTVNFAARALPAEDVVVSVGPLNQDLGVATLSSVTQGDAAIVTTRVESRAIHVPARIVWRGDTWVCRWRVAADEVETVAQLALAAGADGPEFGVTQQPTVTIVNPRVTAIDDCSEVSPLLPADFEDALITYLHDALAEAAANALPASPLDAIGLLRGNVRVTRQSPFANRVGTLVLEADVSERHDALSITQWGLSISMDAATEADRARCAPPTPLSTPPGVGSAPIDPADLSRLGADFAIAASATWLARVAQGATLAGYTCTGLEDARDASVNEEVVPTDDLLLESLGLDHLPLGPFATLVLIPGTLPTVEPKPDQGIIAVTWNDLQLEVYGEVAGARTRLARLVVDAELGLRPVAQVVGVAKFTLASIEVSTDQVDSELTAVAPTQEMLDRWARRTLLSVLEDAFEFPLPIAPPVPVRAVGVQVREQDVVVLLRFE